MVTQLNESSVKLRAFEQLCDRARQLGICIEFYNSTTFVTIRGEEFELEDFNRNVVREFPPPVEYKLVAE